MTHQAKVVDKKQIADGAIAVTLRCCDDPATDSTATIYVTPDTELKSWLDAEKKRVQDNAGVIHGVRRDA